ncbi:T9SS type A sorting domain-containing protein [bacterium]|nr:T9SS type A sorting domain-containing protein [bacterium]MBU1984100.1 T9SS type A sorting domain-containing protein [bacterium]
MKGLAAFLAAIAVSVAAVSTAEVHPVSISNSIVRKTEARAQRILHTLDEIVYWEGWENGDLSDWIPSDGLWRIEQDTSSTNGTLVIVCNDSTTGLYPPGVTTTLTSPLIDLRSISGGWLAANLMISGYLPRQQTYPDCDWWKIEVSRDSGVTWCNAFNPTCDSMGTDYVFSDCPSQWQDFFEPFFFTPLMGYVIQLRLYFQSNLDTLVDSGLRFDNVILEYWPPAVNDISCYSLQVRYPNLVNRPFRITAYFRNESVGTLHDVQTWWRVIGNPWRPFFGVFSLPPGEMISRDTALALSISGTYAIQARSGYGGDQNPANDTTTVESVVVWPAGSDILIGYDNRTMSRSLDYSPGSGPLVHFTPVRDSVVGLCYRLDRIRARFSAEQTGDREMRWHVYRDAGGSPGEEILDTVIVVHSYETGPESQREVTFPADLYPWWYEDFWVWLEVTNDTEPEHFPQILGENAEPWPDIHYYVWNGDGTPTPSAYFYQIQAVIIDCLPVSDDAMPIPITARLEQNYPNPFNSRTYIRFDVPKSGLVTIDVCDLLGRHIATLTERTFPAGRQSVVFDASTLGSGIYFCRMRAGDYNDIRKMVLLR